MSLRTGAYFGSTLQAVKNAGFTNAAATIDGFVLPTSDPYQLERRPLDADVTVAEVKAWIDDAAANKKWLILNSHRIDTSADQYSITPTNFGLR